MKLPLSRCSDVWIFVQLLVKVLIKGDCATFPCSLALIYSDHMIHTLQMHSSQNCSYRIKRWDLPQLLTSCFLWMSTSQSICDLFRWEEFCSFLLRDSRHPRPEATPSSFGLSRANHSCHPSRASTVYFGSATVFSKICEVFAL